MMLALILCMVIVLSSNDALNVLASTDPLPNPNQATCSANDGTYCDASKPLRERVEDLNARLTLKEKVAILSSSAGVDRLGIKPLPWGEALHGVVSHCTSSSQCPTSFPHSLALASSFNSTLWRAIGSAIGDEARALNNMGVADDIGMGPYAPLFVWAPNINPYRDPRWGRGHETPGEDPFLCGEFITHYAKGLQEEKGEYIKAVSFVKHAFGYDNEGNHAVTRESFAAEVTLQDIANYYQVPFKAGVQGGGIKGMMCSYNQVNGMPMCMNSHFFNTLSRDQWGFEGAVVSDCDAIGDAASQMYIEKHFNGSVEQQANQALVGGCDFNCGSFWANHLESSVKSNVTAQSHVDVAVGRLFTLAMKLGLLDDHDHSKKNPFTKYGEEYLDHGDLALEGAQQAMVLLQNKGNILPLSKATKLAIIGPQMNATKDLLSNYHGDNINVNSDSPLQALSRVGNVVSRSQGCALWGDDASGFDDAIHAANQADVALVFVGLHPQWFDSPNDGDAMEGEGLDRVNITLSKIQLQLVQAVVSTGKPVVVVLINGGQVSIPWIKDNVDGIVEAWYPGERGGSALASLLFGEVSFSGRLPYTMYDDDFVSRRPNIQDMELRSNGGITYQYYTGKALWQFGHGLTYTTFQFYWENHRGSTEVTLASDDIASRDWLVYKVKVQNSGTVTSSLSVLAFIEPLAITGMNNHDMPLRELGGYCRVESLGPSHIKSCEILVSTLVISHADAGGVFSVLPGTYRISIGDPSSGGSMLYSTLTVTDSSQA